MPNHKETDLTELTVQLNVAMNELFLSAAIDGARYGDESPRQQLLNTLVQAQGGERPREVREAVVVCHHELVTRIRAGQDLRTAVMAARGTEPGAKAFEVFQQYFRNAATANNDTTGGAA